MSFIQDSVLKNSECSKKKKSCWSSLSLRNLLKADSISDFFCELLEFFKTDILLNTCE